MKVAFALAVALVLASAAMAQVPKFTIVSIATDPPGPHAPGAKFKIKVTVRNDGDTIPAGRRFDFIFTGPNVLSIAPPTGTPTPFFGYCPGATPTNMICQCFAAWPSGETVEMETEVTAGSNASGTLTVTFTVRSGTVSGTATATVQIALAGPDLISDLFKPFKTQIRGRRMLFSPIVTNIGTMPTQGQFKLTVALSAGLNFYRTLSGLATATDDSVLAPGGSNDFSILTFGSITFDDLGVQSLVLTVSGGGDVNPSNNSKTFEFEVIREDPDPLNRLEGLEKLAEILGR